LSTVVNGRSAKARFYKSRTTERRAGGEMKRGERASGRAYRRVGGKLAVMASGGVAIVGGAMFVTARREWLRGSLIDTSESKHSPQCPRSAISARPDAVE
jgi:hypothetical protein